MLRRTLDLPRDLPAAPEATTPRPNAFDAQTFDRSYFAVGSNYGGRYDWYNPPHKIAGYLREIRRLIPAGDLLDVGCAFGRFLERARAHYRCEGMDISAYALGIARERLAGIPLHQSSLEAFAPGRTFDVVTCFDVLEHVPDLDLALRRLRALLRPTGILAVAVPVYDTPPGWVFGQIDRDPTHVHRYGRGFWRERLRAHGLIPVVMKGILRVPLPRFFLHLISGYLRAFSSAVFIVCVPGNSPPPR